MKNIVHLSDLILYKENAENIIEFIEKNKIKNIEFFIEPLDKEYTIKMEKVLQEIEYDSISFHGPFRKFNMAVMTEESWLNTLKSYEESFKIAQKYKPKYMVLHSNEVLSGISINTKLKLEILDKIKKIVELGRQYNIEIAVENVGLKNSMIFNQNEYEDLILENNFKALIDIGHAYINKWDIYSLLKKLKNNIVGFHFHNNDGEYDQHRAMAKGQIDYNKLTEIIRKEFKNVVIVLEYDYTENKVETIKDYCELSKFFER